MLWLAKPGQNDALVWIVLRKKVMVKVLVLVHLDFTFQIQRLNIIMLQYILNRRLH